MQPPVVDLLLMRLALQSLDGMAALAAYRAGRLTVEQLREQLGARVYRIAAIARTLATEVQA